MLNPHQGKYLLSTSTVSGRKPWDGRLFSSMLCNDRFIFPPTP